MSHLPSLASAGAILLALCPAAAAASPSRLETPIGLYVRARAAAVDGDATAASTDYTTLLERDPNPVVAERAYRHSIVGGDPALTVRAARLLDKANALPPDGRLLLVIEAIRLRDWAAARTATDKLEQEKLFAFLAPMLRAWIAEGAHQGDALALMEPAKAISLAQPYLPEQRALLLIAMGQVEEGISGLRNKGPASIERLSVHTRLLLADALAGTGQKDRGIGLIEGDDPVLAAARARLAAGRRLPVRIDGPQVGVASLLVAVAADFARQRLTPIGLTFGRFATFLAPQDANGWLFTAEILGQTRQRSVALAALDHVAPDDPLASIGRTLRIALLTQIGDKQAALADALKDVQRDGASSAAWARVGDVYMTLDQPKDAAPAYAKAIDAAAAVKAPADQQWPLLLQRAEALDLTGDWPAAREALGRALALAPDQPLVLNQLGYSEIAHREDVANASALIERASKLRPDDSAITDSLGWSYYLRGDPGRALPILEKASVGNPGEPTINEHLGDVYWASGRYYEARYSWRAALVTAEDKDKARLSTKIDTGLTPATASP